MSLHLPVRKAEMLRLLSANPCDTHFSACMFFFAWQGFEASTMDIYCHAKIVEPMTAGVRLVRLSGG